MSEVAALLAAFREATGREAALWERRDGSVQPTLLAASSPSFAQRTADGPASWDVNAWARAQGLTAHLANTGDSVGWMIVESGLSVETDRLLGRLVPFVRDRKSVV